MKYFLLLLAASGLFTATFAQDGYTKTPKGMYYKIIPTGSGPVVPPAGLVRFYIEQKINDSVIFSSFGKGLSTVMMKQADKNVDEHLDIFKKMRAGDSLVTLNLADDLMKNKELVLPEFIHAGDSLFQCIRIADCFASEKELNLEKERERKLRLAIDQQQLEKFIAAQNITTTKTKLGGYIQVLKKGVGPVVAKGSKVSVKYTGKNLSGQIFDSNELQGEEKPLLEFIAGAGQMITGFDEAVGLMQKGSRFRVYVPSVNAYGEAGSGEFIQPNDSLIFDIELVKMAAPVKKPVVKKPVVKKKK
jgi:FKBP-type peptidyl-prolyl cis-trans isomerase FkpA